MNKLISFDEFKPVSKAEWKAKVIADLKGKDFDQLIWHTREGLTVQPFYTQEDLADIPWGALAFPRQGGGTAGTAGEARIWENLERVPVIDAKQANQKALEALNQGADGIIFEVSNDTPEFDVLLKDIILAYCPLYFTGDFNLVAPFVDYARKRQLSESHLTGGLLCTAPEMNRPILLNNPGNLPGFKTCCIRCTLPNEEENRVRQLVDILHQTVNVLDVGTDKGIAPQAIFDKLIIQLEMGNSYFFEIAKLRACRILIAVIAAAYEVKDFHSSDLHIHCHIVGKTHLGNDAYNNMLSNTTQSMAAILGGCNSLYVQPHEQGKAKHTEGFPKRIARNISLILKEEAYFHRVADPVAGSYYIEALTEQLVEKVWETFLKEK